MATVLCEKSAIHRSLRVGHQTERSPNLFVAISLFLVFHTVLHPWQGSVVDNKAYFHNKKPGTTIFPYSHEHRLVV